MTKVETKQEMPEKSRSRGLTIALVTAAIVIAGAAVFLLATGDDPVSGTDEAAELPNEALHPHEELLESYASARNSGDLDALVALFTGRAEQKRHPLEPWEGEKRHPLDPLGYLNGQDEIRMVEGEVAAVQGSGSGVEFYEIEVNENPVSDPDVEFKWRFLYGADGSDAGGEAGCTAGERGAAFIENGKIAVFDWGFSDPTGCES